MGVGCGGKGRERLAHVVRMLELDKDLKVMPCGNEIFSSMGGFFSRLAVIYSLSM